MIKITFISVGTELFFDRINTNLFYISKKISSLGLKISTAITVPDDKEKIVETLKSVVPSSDIIIITGGLGPTKDDLTVKSVSEFVNKKIVLNKEVYQSIVRYFIDKGIEMPKLAHQQAYVIDGAEVYINKNGLAPGQKIVYNKKIIYLLPGPPRECHPMFDENIFPELKKFQTGITKETVIHLCNVPESRVEEIISAVVNSEKKYSSDIDFAFLPHLNIVDIKIIVSGKNELLVDEELRLVKKEIYDCFKDKPEQKAIYGEDNVLLETVVAELLCKHKKTLAVAESCTGGMIANRITHVPGSSLYFVGGIVAYSNMLKMNLLNVKKETLETYGAVSEQVVKEMVSGLKMLTKADYCAAVSGIAGPTGGTKEKPVGTVWFCVSDGTKFFTECVRFKGSRVEIKEQATNFCLDLIRRIIMFPQ